MTLQSRSKRLITGVAKSARSCGRTSASPGALRFSRKTTSTSSAARATTGWSVRSASYLALAGYACILVNYMIVNVYFVGQHSYSGV